MTDKLHGAILLVCADENTATAILDHLDAEGLSVVGPAPTAGLALMLAAQNETRSAILVGETTGSRSADQLAAELTATWGVECFLLPAEGEQSDPVAEQGPLAGVRRLLARAERARRLH